MSENKTVDGINRLFVQESRNQSSLNRLLTQSPYDLTALNEARLNVLASLPGTQMKPSGVFSLDDTLLIDSGTHFAEIAPLWDHVSERYVLAMIWSRCITAMRTPTIPRSFSYGSPSTSTPSSTGCARSGPAERGQASAQDRSASQVAGVGAGGVGRRQKQQPELAALYDSKLHIGEHLLQTWGAAHPDLKLPVAFDSRFTQPGFCQYLDQTLHWPYVGRWRRMSA